MAHSPRGEPIAADIESLVAPVSHLRHTTSFQNHSWSAFPQDVAAPLLLDPVAMVGTREVQRNGSDVIKTGKGMEHTLTQPGMPLPMSMGMD